jgi:hypothetical protein
VIAEYLTNLRETDFTRKVRRCLQLVGEMVGGDLLRQLASVLDRGVNDRHRLWRQSSPAQLLASAWT